MAGASSDFNSTDFRANIKAAMHMGVSNATPNQPTFVFTDRSNTYPAGTALDETGRPYDLSILPISAAPANVLVDCAVEYFGSADFTVQAVGDFEGAHAVLTVLDTDYALIQKADYCLLGTEKYEIRKTVVIALFDVDVYRLYLYDSDAH